jgi:hypothetical protein
MSDEPTSQDPAGSDPGGPPPLTPEEQEMLERQMAEVRVEDLLTQTVASVLNLSARRIVKEDEVDLEQARIGIDAVRALVALLPPEVGEAVREPLSQVQMLYAQRAGGDIPGEGPPAGADDPSGGGAPGDGPSVPPESPASPGPESGPPKGPGLWTPRGS